MRLFQYLILLPIACCGCSSPLLPYSVTRPAAVQTTLRHAGIADGRASFRTTFCALVARDLLGEERECDRWLTALSDEPPPAREDTNMRLTLRDSFKETSWGWNATEEDPKLVSFLPVTFPAKSHLVADIGPVRYDISQSNFTDLSYDHSYQSYDRVLGINFGMDNMAFGEQQNRKTVMLEAVLAGSANEKRDAFNLAAVIGIQKFFEPASNGYGFSLRGSFVLPQTETIFSIPLRMIRIGTLESNRQWKPTMGLRIDQGFTSFATTFLQVTKDYAAQRDGHIETGISVGAGIQIAAPTCRIPLVKTLACE
jgi:hypothetical protein